MGQVPGRNAASGPDAPQSPSPPTMPGGAVALANTGLASVCLFTLLFSRRIPVSPPPVYVGCGFDDFNYQGHKGIDFYKTVSDVYVPRSCDFQGQGVPGANVYPAFGGCFHQGVAGKAKVIYAADAGGEIGNCIILEHTDNTHLVWIRTCYMHLDTVAVVAGAFVTTTSVIGTVGHTGGYPIGNSHLHFEVWEQRAANSGWRTAAEIATMPNVVQLGRSVIDPEKYLPPVQTEELLHIASPPPPAFNPPLPAVELPSWRPHPQFPVDLNYTSWVYFVDGGWSAGPPFWWSASILKQVAGSTLNIYPFLDAPDGKIYVIRTELCGIHTSLWLLHSSANYEQMITTYYILYGPATLDVAAGQWITFDTKIAHITSIAPASPGLEWAVIARQAPWTDTNPPFDLSAVDIWENLAEVVVHPSCYLAIDPSTPPGDWNEWPPPDYPGCP